MMKKMLERARVRLIHRLGGMDREKIDLESRPLIQYRQFPVVRVACEIQMDSLAATTPGAYRECQERLVHMLAQRLESEKAVRFEVEQNGQHRGARLRASVYVAVTD